MTLTPASTRIAEVRLAASLVTEIRTILPELTGYHQTLLGSLMILDDDPAGDRVSAAMSKVQAAFVALRDACDDLEAIK